MALHREKVPYPWSKGRKLSVVSPPISMAFLHSSLKLSNMSSCCQSPSQKNHQRKRAPFAPSAERIEMRWYQTFRSQTVFCSLSCGAGTCDSLRVHLSRAQPRRRREPLSQCKNQAEIVFISDHIVQLKVQCAASVKHHHCQIDTSVQLL